MKIILILLTAITMMSSCKKDDIKPKEEIKIEKKYCKISSRELERVELNGKWFSGPWYDTFEVVNGDNIYAKLIEYQFNAFTTPEQKLIKIYINNKLVHQSSIEASYTVY